MLSSMSHSTYAEDHANRFLDPFAASTLVKYLSALIAWLRICEDMHVDPWSLNDSSLADIILRFSSCTPFGMDKAPSIPLP